MGFSFPSPIGHLFEKNHDTQKKNPFKNDIMQKIHGCLIIFNLLPDMSLRNIQRFSQGKELPTSLFTVVY